MLNLESTFYYTESEFVQDTANHRRGGWGDFLGATQSYGFDIRNTSFLNQHSVTYGVDYRFDTSNSQYLEPAKAGFPSPDKFKEKGEVGGIYIQDHWQAMDPLLLSFGMRYDHYDLEEKTKGDPTVYNSDVNSDAISLNMGFNYNFTDEWKLTAGYAEAMRGKQVSDSFTLADRTFTAFDAGLKAEKVNNTEVGLQYDNGSLLASASVYRSRIEDVVADQLGGGTLFENIGEMESKGYELMLGYYWEKLSAVASFVHNDVELNDHDVEGYENIGLANSRGDTWNFDLNYQPHTLWQLGWHYTRVEDLNNIETLHRAVDIGWTPNLQNIDKDGYDVHDVYIRWLPTKSFTLDFAVHNLFDEDYRDHSTVGDYSHIAGWETVVGNDEAGRDVRLTASYAF